MKTKRVPRKVKELTNQLGFGYPECPAKLQTYKEYKYQQQIKTTQMYHI